MTRRHKKRLKPPPSAPIPEGDAAKRNQKMRERASTVEVVQHKVSARRRKCENDLQLFCKTYLKNRFPLENSDDQKESIQKIQHASLTGGQFAQAAPRGDGKTQRSIAGGLWCSLYGHRRYVVSVGATGVHGKRLVAEIEQELADNEKLMEDWPEVCVPIRRAFSSPQGARALRVIVKTKDGKLVHPDSEPQDPRLICSTGKLVLPTVKDAVLGNHKPSGGNVIEGAGVTAAFRGLRHTTAGGETIRPELAILDDVQTRKSAMSIGQTDRVMQILRGDIKRLAGPDKELAVVCNCTVVRRGDAADQLLDNKANPQWRGVRK